MGRLVIAVVSPVSTIFPLVHHGDAGGEIAHDRHGVGDEQISQAEVALELGEEIDDLGADADVERGDGLVAHDKFRAQRQGTGDADALALSAGKFVGIAGAGGFVEANGAQQFADLRRMSSFARLDSRGRLSPHDSSCSLRFDAP